MADPTETSKQCRRVRASECVSTAFLNARTRGPPPPFPPNDNGTEPKNRPAEDLSLIHIWFISSKHNPDSVSYKHPSLVPILSNTYGCIVYQEQVIEIFRRLAGYSLGQADMVRRAMSKKKMKDIQREREAFLHGDPCLLYTSCT